MPTLVCNDPPLDVVNDRRRYVRFDRGARHPYTLGPDDILKIIESGAFLPRRFAPDAPRGAF